MTMPADIDRLDSTPSRRSHQKSKCQPTNIKHTINFKNKSICTKQLYIIPAFCSADYGT